LRSCAPASHNCLGYRSSTRRPLALANVAARLVVLIDVRGTGLSGYEIGRRMRRFSGVPLEFCREHRLLVVFHDDEEIATRGERLLFALGHACQPSTDAVSPGSKLGG